MIKARLTPSQPTLENLLLSRLADGLSANDTAPEHWQERIPQMFSAYFWHEFSQPHIDLWEWATAVERDNSPAPFCAFWPRGRGKSTNAEAVAVDLGARQKRGYCMYVAGTQDQADKHVQTIARMMESDGVTQFYPDVGTPQVGKNGGRTWNRRIVRTANGYTIEAVGLNKAVRGQKIDWARPDLIIFDDIDEKHDSENTTAKKEEVITGSILPAGSTNVAILFVQNLIHRNSIASRLARPTNEQGSANYIMTRQISGPYPAVEGLGYELHDYGDGSRWTINKGKSIWAGYGLDICEEELNRVGPTAFMIESQHDVDSDSDLALWRRKYIDDPHRRPMPSPEEFKKIAVGVDPSGGANEIGIVVVGATYNEHFYVLADLTLLGSPQTWASTVVAAYNEWQADVIVGERNYGGQMVEHTIRSVHGGEDAVYKDVNASRGKHIRAEPVVAKYERGLVHHTKHFVELESEMCGWIPDSTMPSPNRLDALVWAMYACVGMGSAEWGVDPFSGYRG